MNLNESTQVNPSASLDARAGLNADGRSKCQGWSGPLRAFRRVAMACAVIAVPAPPVAAQPPETQPAVTTLLYSVFDGTRGCLNRIEASPASGSLRPPEVLAADERYFRITKFDTDRDRRHALFINEFDESEVVGTLPLLSEGGAVEARLTPMPDRPMLLAAHGDTATIAGNDGILCQIRMDSGEILRSRNIGRELTPPAFRPHAIRLSPDARHLVLLYRYDRPDSRKYGHRIVLLDPASLDILQDIHLPRSHGHLHYLHNGQNGPGPAWIRIAPEIDTACIGLELYGAVAFCKWSALKEGRLEDYEMVPTSIDGAWGAGFPGEGFLFQHGNRHYLLTGNESEKGGIAILDVALRRPASLLDTGPRGLASPVLLESPPRLVVNGSGIGKNRTPHGVADDHKENFRILSIHLDDWPGTQPKVETWTYDDAPYRLARLHPESPHILAALNLFTQNNHLVFRTLDSRNGQWVDQTDSLGVVAVIKTLEPTRQDQPKPNVRR